MRGGRRAALATALTTASLFIVVLPASPASAHGSMSDPPSRVYVCKTEGPDSPKSDACKAAVAVGGTQPFYDWNEVSRIEAGGRHREIIPDGQLCGAGRAKYAGLDLRRADWPAKRVAPGPLTVTYHASAPHGGSNFEFYLTRDGWDPTQPLRWSDLVPLKTFTNQNPTTYTNWTIDLPRRTGRHVLYSIWQRVLYSTEAFYTCSDVDFGGGTGTPSPTASPTPSATPSPSASPTRSPSASPTRSPSASPTATRSPSPTATAGGTWQAGTAYRVGDKVTYGGVSYQCRQAHTALQGWEPPNTPSLWQAV